ncbi:MAG: inverse autotransporter beta domain-containing protein, partial [Pseudomonadota bacterium]
MSASDSGRAAAVAAILLIAPAQAAAADKTSAPKWSPWLEFGGYYSSESSRGEAAAFAPLLQNQSSLFFFDLRTKLFEQAVNEGNFALGYRQMIGDWNLGLWAGYDRRRTAFGSVFNQVSAGFEALSANWDLRANVYLPLNHEKLISQTTTTIPTSTSVAIVGS